MVLVMNFKLLRAYVGCWDNCVNIQGTKNIKILAKFPQPSAGLFPSVVCPYFGSVFAMGFARILPTAWTWVYPRRFCLIWVFFWITPERRFSSITISSCPNCATLPSILELTCRGTLQLINSWIVFQWFSITNWLRHQAMDDLLLAHSSRLVFWIKQSWSS